MKGVNKVKGKVEQKAKVYTEEEESRESFKTRIHCSRIQEVYMQAVEGGIVSEPVLPK